MAGNTLAALSIATPENSGVQAFQASQSNALNQRGARMQQEAAAFEKWAQVGLGIMGGNPDGEINQQALSQLLEMSAGDPLAERLKANPELLRTITKGSLSLLSATRDEARFEMEKQRFELELAAAQKPAEPKLTDDQREYNMAVEQGYKGTIVDYQQDLRKSGATNVSVGPNGEEYGDPGAGLVWQRGADGKVALDERGAPIAIPFQGGKAYADMMKAEAAGAAKDENKETKAGIVVEDVDRALALIKKDPFWTTGIMGQWLSNLGGTPATDVKRLTETVKANAGFNELQAMRDSSPSGAALGAITERELLFLQSVIGSLEQDQRSDQLIFNLDRVKRAFLDIVHGPGNWDDSGEQTPESAPAEDGVIDWTDMDWGD
jgi:hypothetical protein